MTGQIASECAQINKMARVGTLFVITSFVFFCNTVSGQHAPTRPKLSESFSAKVRVAIIA